MTKEEIVYKIEQIAHNGAFDGINADYVEREAEKLADKIVKLFTIPVVVGQSEQLKAFVEWWHGLSQEELVWYEGRYVEVFLSL